MKRSVTLMCLFALFLLLGRTAAFGQPPGAGDVKVEWDAGPPAYPKKVGTDLKLKGTVTYANGWSSVDGKVNVTIVPTNGGSVMFYILTPDANGVWAVDIPLANFPSPPKRNYDITPSVQAKKGVQVASVTGPRKTMELP